MISNSVTHLLSYTNTAIADIAKNSKLISSVTPRDHRRLHIERRRPASRADIVALNDKSFMMFHNVLRVFHDVLLVVHDVSQCFTCVWCLTMFYDV